MTRHDTDEPIIVDYLGRVKTLVKTGNPLFTVGVKSVKKAIHLFGVFKK